MISAELRLKLQKRLQLQKESEDALESRPRLSPREDLNLGIEVPVLAGYYKSSPQETPSLNRSGRTWSYQSRASLGKFEGEVSTEVEELVAAVEELQDLIASTNMQRDEARQRQQGIEAISVARSIELGAEVARLRINIEVLRRDLDAAQQEVRISPSRGRKVSQTSQEDLSRSTEICSDERVVAQVSRACSEHALLAEKVRILEEEVAGSVVERAKLEGLLRHCLLRESEAHRRLQALESAAGRKSHVGEVFALDLDDGDELEIHRDLGDLELCYEDGLELSRLMPMQQALRLARGQEDALEMYKDTNQLATASSSSASSVPVKEDSEYFDAPLKALELALTRLRGGEESNDVNKDEALNVRYHANESLQSVEASEGEKARTMLKSELVNELVKSTALPSKELVTIPEPIGIHLLSPYAALGRRFSSRILR